MKIEQEEAPAIGSAFTFSKITCSGRKNCDSDGKTNGEELGDPDCVWVKGSIPAVTDLDLISHPGVCEPITSPGCQEVNGFLAKHGCEALGLTTPSTDAWCPAIKEEGVESITYTFENHELNDEETNYLCRYLDIPSDEEYQLIAVMPFSLPININSVFVSYFSGNLSSTIGQFSIIWLFMHATTVSI